MLKKRQIDDIEWNERILKVVDFFNQVIVPERIRLSECEIIEDPKKFLKTHLKYLQVNSKRKIQILYLERLEKLKRVLE